MKVINTREHKHIFRSIQKTTTLDNQGSGKLIKEEVRVVCFIGWLGGGRGVLKYKCSWATERTRLLVYE